LAYPGIETRSKFPASAIVPVLWLSIAPAMKVRDMFVLKQGFTQNYLKGLFQLRDSGILELISVGIA
jgi:hypothetical protein